MKFYIGICLVWVAVAGFAGAQDQLVVQGKNLRGKQFDRSSHGVFRHLQQLMSHDTEAADSSYDHEDGYETSAMTERPECCADSRWSDYPGRVRCTREGECCIAMCDQEETSYRPVCCKERMSSDYVGRVRCTEEGKCCRALCEAITSTQTDPPIKTQDLQPSKFQAAVIEGGQQFEEESAVSSFVVYSNGTIKDDGMVLLYNVKNLIMKVTCEPLNVTIAFKEEEITSIDSIVDQMKPGASLVVHGDVFGSCSFSSKTTGQSQGEQDVPEDGFMIIESVTASGAKTIVVSGQPVEFVQVFQTLHMDIVPGNASASGGNSNKLHSLCAPFDEHIQVGDGHENVGVQITEDPDGAEWDLNLQIASEACAKTTFSAKIDYSLSTGMLEVAFDMDYDYTFTKNSTLKAKHDGLGALTYKKELLNQEAAWTFPVFGIPVRLTLSLETLFKASIETKPSFELSMDYATEFVGGNMNWAVSVNVDDPSATFTADQKHTKPVQSTGPGSDFRVGNDTVASLQGFIGFEPKLSASLWTSILQVGVVSDLGLFFSSTIQSEAYLPKAVHPHELPIEFGICDERHHFEAELLAGMKNVELFAGVDFPFGSGENLGAAFETKVPLEDVELVVEVVLLCLDEAEPPLIDDRVCSDGSVVPRETCCLDTEQRCGDVCILKEECCGTNTTDGTCANSNKNECLLQTGGIGVMSTRCGCMDPVMEVCCSDGQKYLGKCPCSVLGGTFCPGQQSCCPGNTGAGHCYDPASECCESIEGKHCLDGSCSGCCDEDRCEVGGNCCVEDGFKCCNGTCIKEDECCGSCPVEAPNCCGDGSCQRCCEGECSDGSCRTDGCCPGDLCCDPPSECACESTLCHENDAVGDPHFWTFDGYNYDCHGGGDFIYTKSLNSPLEIQGRLEQTIGSASVATGVAVATGGDVVEISFVDVRQGNDFQVLVNGIAVDHEVGFHNNDTQVSHLPDGTYGIFHRAAGTAVFVRVQSSWLNIRVRIPLRYTDENVVGLLGSPDGNLNNDWMDGLGNKLPIFGRGGYSYVANAYCQRHWCIRDIRESLFTYENSTDFEALRKCDETPFGYFDFGQASEELKCLCGDDQACLMDGILFGIDAAQATIQTQLQTQSSGLFRFSPNRIEVGKATEVTVTVDVRGNQSSLVNATSFVLYAVDSDGQVGSTPLVSLVDSGSGRGDDMNAHDHIFSNTITLYPNVTGTLFGFQALPIIEGSLSNAFALQSNTAVQSYSEFNVSVDCDDDDFCTLASPVCNNGVLECSFTPKSCPHSHSCDPLDGQCKGDEQLVPCVAVIDEDGSFMSGGGKNQAGQWADFRTQFPNRPFCLLVPESRGYNVVNAPPSFHSDNNTLALNNLRRDGGVVSLAEDWVTMCGLDKYTSANVEWVGLFIDDSGSMTENQVSASRDLFYSTLASNGIQVQKVVNSNENWIEPFMTTLVPSTMPPTSPPMTALPVTTAPMTSPPATLFPTAGPTRRPISGLTSNPSTPTHGPTVSPTPISGPAGNPSTPTLGPTSPSTAPPATLAP